MTKGRKTRRRIVDQAMRSASTRGVDALTIGTLAQDLGMSKSGLFAHFGSKAKLQRDVVEATVERFVDDVVRPAMSVAHGRAQVRALVQNWIDWSYAEARPGGCSLAAAAFEFDSQTGEVRDLVSAAFDSWRRTLAAAIENGKSNDIPHSLDANSLVLEIFGLYFAQHVFHWLLGQNDAGRRAMERFDTLMCDPD